MIPYPVTIVTICDDWKFSTVTEQSTEKTIGKGAFLTPCEGCDGFPLSLSCGFTHLSCCFPPLFISYYNPKEKGNAHNCHILTNIIKTNSFTVRIENPIVTMFTQTATKKKTIINIRKTYKTDNNTLKRPDWKMGKPIENSKLRDNNGEGQTCKPHVHARGLQRLGPPFLAHFPENAYISVIFGPFPNNQVIPQVMSKRSGNIYGAKTFIKRQRPPSSIKKSQKLTINQQVFPCYPLLHKDLSPVPVSLAFHSQIVSRPAASRLRICAIVVSAVVVTAVVVLHQDRLPLDAGGGYAGGRGDTASAGGPLWDPIWSLTHRQLLQGGFRDGGAWG